MSLALIQVHVNLGIVYAVIMSELFCLVCCKGLAVCGVGHDSSQPTFLERWLGGRYMTTSGSQTHIVGSHMLLKHYIVYNFPFLHYNTCRYIRLCLYSSLYLCGKVDGTIPDTQER